jgi:hypothetical protein
MSHDNPMTIGFIGDEMISSNFAKQKLEQKKNSLHANNFKVQNYIIVVSK